MKALAPEGRSPLLNRGVRVDRLEDKEVENMFEGMAALEKLAGRLAYTCTARILDTLVKNKNIVVPTYLQHAAAAI